jgi:hypothetical protein
VYIKRVTQDNLGHWDSHIVLPEYAKETFTKEDGVSNRFTPELQVESLTISYPVRVIYLNLSFSLTAPFGFFASL